MSAVKFRIDPQTLYSRDALQEELKDEITVEEFLRNIKPRKRFRGLWWGAEIIIALDKIHNVKTPKYILDMPPPRSKKLPSDFIPRDAIFAGGKP